MCVGEWVCVFKERQEEKLNKENKKFLGGCPKDFFFLKGGMTGCQLPKDRKKSTVKSDWREKKHKAKFKKGLLVIDNDRCIFLCCHHQRNDILSLKN